MYNDYQEVIEAMTTYVFFFFLYIPPPHVCVCAVVSFLFSLFLVKVRTVENFEFLYPRLSDGYAFLTRAQRNT